MKELHSIEIDFEKGRVTRHEAAWLILCTLGQNNQQEFDELCSELRVEVGEIINAMAQDRRSTSNICPTESQIELGRKWLDVQGECTSVDNE